MTPDQMAQLAAWTHIWHLAADAQAARVSATGVGSAPPETALYIDAMRNVVRGAEAILGRDHAALTTFRTAVPNAVDVRDMLEHFDDYILGTGNLQRRQTHPRSWRVFASGDIRNGIRRIHVNDYVIELPGAHNALTELTNAALDHAWSITSVSGGQNGEQ